MRSRNGWLLILLQCLLACSSSWAQEDCDEATRELRLCSEERRHLSQQLSETGTKVQDLQQLIHGLESDLRDQQRACRENASESQAEFDKKTQDLDAKLQAARQELGVSKDRVTDLTADLQNASRLTSQLQEDNKRCESMTTQEQARHTQHISELRQQVESLEAARQQSESDVSSFSAVREEAAKLKTELEHEQMQCEVASSRTRAEFQGQIQKLQQKLQATEAGHTSAKSDAETLTVELQSCQVTLGHELEGRKQAEAKAALHASLHAKVSSELKQQEQELAESSHGMKAEIQQLKAKLSKAAEQLHFAEQAYLPLWSMPYYDEAARRAAATKQQAVIYYEREIVTGKAYHETKNAFMKASDRFMGMAKPHVSKAKVVLKPILASVAAKLVDAGEAISSQLQQEKYKSLMQSAQHVREFLYKAWLRTKDYVAGIYESNIVEQARDDLTRMYTLLLGADVSGSGIDLAVPAMMAKYTLFGIPIFLVLPVLLMCCSRPRRKKQPPQPTKSRAPASSKGGEGKRSKKR